MRRIQMNTKVLYFYFGLAALNIVCMDHNTLNLLKGEQIKQEIEFVTQQRIRAFREYPYLYEGNLDEERSYLQWLASIPNAALAIAYSQSKPVGFITGIPVKDFEHHFKGSIRALENAGWPPQDYYYFAEAVVTPEHRGRGIATKLYALIEQYAHSLGYTHGCFVTESHEHHPLKPSGYKELNNRFKTAGYSKIAAAIKFNWQTIQSNGSPQDQEHELQYWIKSFELYIP